ncbi:hypothetical protein D9M72_635360 [compost metagenome]
MASGDLAADYGRAGAAPALAVVVEGDEFRCGQRLGEQPALAILDTAFDEIVGLLLPLDALGDDVEIERLGNVDDMRRNRTGGRVRSDRVDEGFVDLQCVERKLLQVLQA